MFATSPAFSKKKKPHFQVFILPLRVGVLARSKNMKVSAGKGVFYYQCFCTKSVCKNTMLVSAKQL
jgi:hypothetical protein